MDTIGVIMVLVGIIAILVGAYELMKKTVVGRNVSASTPEEIRKFSTIDGITYLVEGVLVILLAFSDQLPFMQNAFAPTLCFAMIVTVVVINFVMARKILSR